MTSPTPMSRGPARTPTMMRRDEEAGRRKRPRGRDASCPNRLDGADGRLRFDRAHARHALCAESTQCRAHCTDEVHEPRAPAGGDRVVDPQDRPVPHRLDARPTGPCGDRIRVLATADGVGERDQIRVGRDDELGRELWVLGSAGRGVRDVLEPEERVDASDEGARGRGEEARVELVVDTRADRCGPALGDDARDLASSFSRRATRHAARGPSPCRAGGSAGRPRGTSSPACGRPRGCRASSTQRPDPSDCPRRPRGRACTPRLPRRWA